MTSRVTLHLKKPVNSPCNQYQSCCTIYPPTVLKSAPGHRQMSRKLFVDNPKLRVPRSTNPIPSVSIDFDTTDDAQSFRSVDVESLWSCHVSIILGDRPSQGWRNAHDAFAVPTPVRGSASARTVRLMLHLSFLFWHLAGTCTAYLF